MTSVIKNSLLKHLIIYKQMWKLNNTYTIVLTLLKINTHVVRISFLSSRGNLLGGQISSMSFHCWSYWSMYLEGFEITTQSWINSASFFSLSIQLSMWSSFMCGGRQQFRFTIIYNLQWDKQFRGFIVITVTSRKINTVTSTESSS